MPGHGVKQPSCLRPRPKTGFRLRGFILYACLVGLGLALLIGLAGAAPPSGKLLVAATIVPLGDFCHQIGRDLVQVQVLIPPGASPHLFEPAPSVMARASQARVFVYIGAGLEPWAARLLRSRGSKNLVVVEAAQGMPLLGLGQQHHHHEAAGAQGHTGKPPDKAGAHETHLAGNPHIWLDPVLAQEIAGKIAQALIQADPGHRAQYEANCQDFQAKLAALDREIKQQAQTWRLRDYVSFHPSFSYFARRYNLHEVGTIEAAPGREPTPRHLKNLVAAIRRYGIKVVFAEPQLNPRVAEVIAQEAGVKVLRLDPMGGAPPYGSDYLQMMRYNLAALDEALR
ncbi:MAG: metal ABC transporter substrate-binding protein [Desulfobacterales bacterium]|nr:metal ABC transporter substrate-binding protein [Pseudomonadota bacterium]MCG2773535.1 metal ABC transporter substrate-binding protein [Desulfobacterales bacterium]